MTAFSDASPALVANEHGMANEHGLATDPVPIARVISAHSGSSVSWSSLKVQAKKKQILTGFDDDGLSGHLKGGGFCAIMGPSGAGKSTLLNALAGRIAFSGDVKLGGQSLSPAELRTKIAYVMQEDILCGTQTPREALLFSAALRLPQSVPHEDKQAMVEQTLTELGLQRCADTLIGDKLIRGISGGEKKRTSIGVELVVRPQVLFLDEPTSGLDSYAAFSVVQNLLELSGAGCTILCTIHQPSSEVFDLFESVLLLSVGATFYFGPAKTLPASLAAQGFACKPNYNPADYVMFLLQTEPPESLKALAAKFRAGADRDAPVGVASESVAVHIERRKRSAGILTEIYYLAQREKNTLLRDRAGLIATIMAPSLLNLLFALIFFQAGDRSKSTYSINTHFGAITQIAIGGMFGASQPLLLKFPLEAALFKREYGVGAYSATTYFLSKTVVELPKSFVVASLTWLVSYWLIDLEGPIMLYILSLWLMGLAASSTALLVGCLSSNVEVALQASPAIFVPQILFAGFFITSSQIPEALRWLQWLCSLRYGINLFMIIEFAPPTIDSWTPPQQRNATALLAANQVEASEWWINVVVLISLVVVFRLVGIVALSHRATASA